MRSVQVGDLVKFKNGCIVEHKKTGNVGKVISIEGSNYRIRQRPTGGEFAAMETDLKKAGERYQRIATMPKNKPRF